MRHQARDAGHTRRHQRQSGAHRFQQHAGNAFARKRGQYERVVALIHRQQTIERHRPDDGHAIGDAITPRLFENRLTFVFSWSPDGGADDVERRVDARSHEQAHHFGQHA